MSGAIIKLSVHDKPTPVNITHPCGANLRHRDGKCRAPAMKRGNGTYGRCRVHGGAGRSKHLLGNKNAMTNGIYCAGITDEEQAELDKLSRTDLENEIDLARNQVVRALKARAKHEAENFAPIIESETESSGTEGSVEFKRKTTVRKYIDWDAKLDRLEGRVESLVAKHAAIVAARENNDGGLGGGLEIVVRRAGTEPG